MTPYEVLLIVFCLFTKHLIIDFPMQVPYHYLNKGTYGHPGGIQHAGLHGWGTMFCFAWFVDVPFAIVLGGIDFVIHYHIDWAKMNLNKKLGYGPLTSEKFWWLLGLDQWLHAVTYVGLIYITMLYIGV